MTKTSTQDSTLIQSNLTHYKNEFNIRSLIKNIWLERKLITAISIAFCITVITLNSTRFLNFSNFDSHEISLRFTFSGAEKGLYPNHSQFQLSDIISNQILTSVYLQHNLASYDLSFSDFSRNVSIRPEGIKRKEIDESYHQKLSTQKISQAEIQNLEKTYQLELNTASHRQAKLTYTTSASKPLPDGLTQSILTSIPENWSRIASTQHGILDLPVISSSSIDTKELANEEYAIGNALMHDYLKLLQKALINLKNDVRAELILDPYSGLNLQALSNQLNTFKNYRLNTLDTMLSNNYVYRDLSTTRAYLISKQQSLNDQLAKTLNQAEIYKAAHLEHSHSSNNLKTGFQPVDGSKTELGDAFIGQLVKLGNKISSSEYRQQLTAKRINLTLKAEDLETDINKLKRQLKNINKARDNSTNKSVEEAYLTTVKHFSQLVSNYQRLINNSKTQILGKQDSLYEQSNLGVVSGTSRAQSKKIGITGIVALLVGTMTGVFFVLLRLAMGRGDRLIES